MDFALTALFVVLLIEQWKKIKEPLPFVIATISSSVAIIIFYDQMLLVSIMLSIIVLMLAKLTKVNSP
jgi:predicted branched-subunit amino acid permease